METIIILLQAICMVESNCETKNNFHDKNHPSYGMYQIQLPTAREHVPSIDALALQMKPVSLKIAKMHLNKLMNKYSNIEDVVAAYNYGHPKRIRSGLYINQDYVNKVMKHYKGHKYVCDLRRCNKR